MIIYKYKMNDMENELHIPDNGPSIVKSNTSYYYALNFVQLELEPIIRQYKDIQDLRILDVGMGNGNVLKCVRDTLDVEVFGFDIHNYLDDKNYIEGKTFPGVDVRNIPEGLLGTFDLAYQRLFSIPYKDTLSVLQSVAKALKSDGLYIVTFDDEEYEHKDSFVLKAIRELYRDVKIQTRGDKIKLCIASSPVINPILTPIESYYYTLDSEEYNNYQSSSKKQRQKILNKKSNNM